MRTVHRIPAVTVLFLFLLPACASSPPRDLPAITPSPTAAPAVPAPRRLPRGFVADIRTGVFHRVACPRAKGIEPKYREYYVDPWEALNHGCSPCPYCQPLAGWK